MDWLEPWSPVSEPRAGALRTELRRELCGGHALYGLGATVLGAREDQDDVLLLLDDGRAAAIHLTWRGAPEALPWPATTLFADLKDWIARGRKA